MPVIPPTDIDLPEKVDAMLNPEKQTKYKNDIEKAMRDIRYMYSVLESFEDNASCEWQPALTSQTTQSRNLVLIWLENPVVAAVAQNREVSLSASVEILIDTKISYYILSTGRLTQK